MKERLISETEQGTSFKQILNF